MASDITFNTALNQQSKTASATVKLNEDFTQFLTLLTTQLQNQDPLSPMDTTEFTNQLVAFSGVEQQINTNQKLDSILQLNLANTFSSALNYVGLDASYLSSEFNFDGTTPVKMKYALDSQAVKSRINVYDEEGALVYTREGALSGGNNDFTWDGTLTTGGTAPKGTYEIEIAAFDKDNKQINTTTVVTGHIRGIETQNGQIFALIGDRAVSLSTILNTSLPQPVVTQPPDEEGA